MIKPFIDFTADAPECTMTEVALNQEDQSYMYEDIATPVKACSNLGYHVTTGCAFCFQVIIFTS